MQGVEPTRVADSEEAGEGEEPEGQGPVHLADGPCTCAGATRKLRPDWALGQVGPGRAGTPGQGEEDAATRHSGP